MTSSNTDSFDSLHVQHVDNLLKMITKSNTTSILNQLEYHRQNLSVSAFGSLLLSLTTELNSTNWKKSLDHQDVQAFQRRRSQSNSHWQRPSKARINHCCCVIFYYIVSVIDKYQIPSVENLWNEILGNSLTEDHKVN
jgi:hypothetical protein